MMSSTTVAPDQLRPKLLAMSQEQDPYPFLTVVENYLAAVPEDDQLRALAASALMQKGLHSVALEYLRACPPHTPKADEFRDAVDQVGRCAPELIDWATTEACFAANLTSLRERGDRERRLADAAEQAWQDAPELTLHRANDGNLLVRGRTSGGHRIWIPAALDFAGRVEVLNAEKLKNTVVPPFLLDSVGAGYLLPRLHACSACTFLNYSPAVFLVETNLRALAVALRVHDWTSPLRDERVYVFAGPAAWDEWYDLMCAEPKLPIPTPITGLARWPGDATPPTQQKLGALREYRTGQYTGCCRDAARVYNGRDAAFWAKRLSQAGAGDPLRVLGVTSRFTTFLQYSMRDCLAAFERAGAVTRLLTEERDHYLIPHRAYMETLADFQPDLVVVIDHHRHEYDYRDVPNVPYVCWIQDDMPNLYSPGVGEELGLLDFTIGNGFNRCVLDYGYPAQRFMPCKPAIDPAKFAPQQPRDAGSCIRCDVAYVSHHSETPAALHARIRQSVGDKTIIRLLDAFYEEITASSRSPEFNAGCRWPLIFRRAAHSTGIRCIDPAMTERLKSMYLRPLVDRVLRHDMLEWVADWAEGAGRVLHIYGRGWDRHPRFARHDRGVADHGRHLAAIARQAAINLHAGLTPALHQRVLEILSAGGFAMVRYHPEDFFDPGRESLCRYLRENGIDQPTRIPLEQFPQAYIESRRREADEMGEPPPQCVEVTRQLLLLSHEHSLHDERYRYANLAFPGFDRVVFDSPESFAQRADRFIENPDERHALAQAMGEGVHELFTYDAIVRELMKFLPDALRTSAGPAQEVPVASSQV